MQNQNIDIETKLEDDSTLVAFLKGEIDHHTAAKIRSLLDIKIESIHPKLLVLDFTQITFMDSSGIGLVMGRYKLMKYFGGNLKIINPSPQIKKVMSLAGFDRLAVIEKTKAKAIVIISNFLFLSIKPPLLTFNYHTILS